MKVDVQAVKAKAASYTHLLAQEAVELLRRRKLRYAALALTLTAGSLYFSGVRPALATSGGHSAAPNSPVQLQTVTGQSTESDNNISAQNGASGQQSHTSVTVNGTDIPVPANGEVHTTMTNDGGTTSVSISHNSSSGDNSYSSLNVQVSSQGTASQEGD